MRCLQGATFYFFSLYSQLPNNSLGWNKSLGWNFAQIPISIWVGITVWGGILWKIAHIREKSHKTVLYVLNYIQIYKILQISVILRECVQFCTKFQPRLLFYSGLQKIFSIGKSNSSGGAKCKVSHNDFKFLVKLLYIMPYPNIEP